MAMSTGGSVLVDLEKELTCSICTEILYQPLTLLDCLHTFCGSCLKNWFSSQVSNAPDANYPLLSCPSCRASVRDTRHDAKVTTLLDLYLQSNPEKDRSDAEKEEISREYTPAKGVLPVVKRVKRSTSDIEDERLLAEVRDMSIREMQQQRGSRDRHRRHSSGVSGSSPRRRDRSPVERVREQRVDDARRRRRVERRMASSPVQIHDIQNLGGNTSLTISRQVEHQSSLRSLLSSSTSDESAIEEEILRQIAEEGLLDGVDLRALTPSQEDELTERIAQAFRRRHMTQESPSPSSRNSPRRSEHPRTPRSPTSVSASASASTPTLVSTRDRGSPRSSRSAVGTSHQTQSTQQLLEPVSTSPTTAVDPPSHRRSASDQGAQQRRRTSPTPSPRNVPSASSESLLSPATTRRLRTRSPQSRPRTRSTSLATPSSATERRRTSNGQGSQQGSSRQNASSRSGSSARGITSRSRHAASTTSLPATSTAAAASQPEPICCDRCKADVQYELHKYCPKCKSGKYTLCLRCFRQGRGCLHWFGFGDSAQYFFDKRVPAASRNVEIELPHRLIWRRYRQSSSSSSTTRLESGMFCDMCLSYSDDCFWRCGECNDGEWGFCNRCVNQDKCCTHPLLPVGRNASNNEYNTLTFSTKCNLCSTAIPVSSTRFHCPTCNGGDYDVCTSCYLKLGVAGKISRENGRSGWRRCLQGHRMVVVGFEGDGDPGAARRVVVQGLVGGYLWKDEYLSVSAPSRGKWTWNDDSEHRHRRRVNRIRHQQQQLQQQQPDPSTRYPPSGGIGLHLVAQWSHYPDEAGQGDELCFPRGAEITEAENINDDWLWGYYAGQTGFVPGGHVVAIGEVVMGDS